MVSPCSEVRDFRFMGYNYVLVGNIIGNKDTEILRIAEDFCRFFEARRANNCKRVTADGSIIALLPCHWFERFGDSEIVSSSEIYKSYIRYLMQCFLQGIIRKFFIYTL